MTPENTVCAVVVTYNRKELLLRCIRVIESQSHKVNAICIVDNASQDGTPEALLSTGYIKNIPSPAGITYGRTLHSKVIYVRLAENSGGAGGFHEGMKTAFAEGYDLLWLMDDDGLPDADCLRKLIEKMHEYSLDVIGPIVLDIENPELLAFPYRDCRTLSDCYSKATGGILPGRLNPFNGILVKRQVVEKIGYPRKEFFIWGDEVEYYYRMKKAGCKIATALDAKFYHPKNRLLMHKILGGRLRVWYTENPERNFIFLRNYFYVSSRYDRIKFFVALLMYTYFYFFVRKAKPHEIKLFLKALLYGILGIWKR